MELSLIVTGDGSNTLYVNDWKENYHSIHGAITESVHVFINNGFLFTHKRELNILEIGFGTGLNCLLTAMKASDTGKSVTYVGLEKYPLNESIHNYLNYPQLIGGKYSSVLFDEIFNIPWGKFSLVSKSFLLGKYNTDVAKEAIPVNLSFDLIYYDAFSPDIQPELWSLEILEKIYYSAAEGGIFITYCAKGSVRRMLEKIGFSVERLPGPPGKREILRGIKKPNMLNLKK